jgi:hypothetical protein
LRIPVGTYVVCHLGPGRALRGRFEILLVVVRAINALVHAGSRTAFLSWSAAGRSAARSSLKQTIGLPGLLVAGVRPRARPVLRPATLEVCGAILPPGYIDVLGAVARRGFPKTRAVVHVLGVPSSAHDFGRDADLEAVVTAVSGDIATGAVGFLREPFRFLFRRERQIFFYRDLFARHGII